MSDSSPQISRPSGPVAEHRGLEQHLAVLGRVVKVGADLLDDDRALTLDVRRLEPRTDDQLADHVHRALDLAQRDAHPVDRRFTVGRRVERPADTLDGLADGARGRIRGGALERDVLHEMGDADLPRDLEPRPGQDVGGDRDRARRREPRADHPGPGRQRGPFEHRRGWYRIERAAPAGATGATRSVLCQEAAGMSVSSQACRK